MQKKFLFFFMLILFQNISFCNRGPDFLIIGAPKCGTSSLYNYIIQHPLIQSASQKEVRFFTRNYKKGLKWYLSNFPRRESESHLLGEATPEYLVTHGVAKKVYKNFPQVKLIIILRNPVDRAYSAYQHGKRSRWPVVLGLGGKLKQFDQCINKNSNIITRGVYIKYIKQWFSVFPRDQLLVLDFEDLVTSPLEVVTKIFGFLNLPFYEKINFSVRNSGGSYPKMDSDIRAHLVEYYKKYNYELEKFLNVKFDWHL